MNNVLLEKYARLLVKIGVCLQENQTLVISSPLECAFFARIIAETAYKEGAKDVVMNWNDQPSTRIKLLYAPESTLEVVPNWRKEFYISLAREGAAFISIAADDPDLMSDVDPARMSLMYKNLGLALKEYRERMMCNRNKWCVASVPTEKWAQKVFPDDTLETAMNKLWNAILNTVRVDKDDPVSEWKKHITNLKKSLDFLNTYNFKHIHMKNSIGTDVTIELPEKHLWTGGSDLTPEGVEFVANMPTEEVFTMPKKTGVNGRVVSSMPLNYNGSLIENFSLTFKDGKVVEYTAEKGKEFLKEMISIDEGASYLGEIALVPVDSPISNMGILFYNTLFDENASSHVAIGNAYPTNIKGGENMSREELDELGANYSLTHIDFMIGTDDMTVTGMTHDGVEVAIMKDGNFVF
ncbi:MAG: aminopeptidase [Bacillota bacterium]